MALRHEFEPLLISRYGLHRDAAPCRAVRDRDDHDEAHLNKEIAHATEWLSQWPKTAAINRKAGTSPGLRHVAEYWPRARVNKAMIMVAPSDFDY